MLVSTISGVTRVVEDSRFRSGIIQYRIIYVLAKARVRDSLSLFPAFFFFFFLQSYSVHV